MATELTPTSAQPLHPERWEVFIVFDEKNEPEPEPLASMDVSD